MRRETEHSAWPRRRLRSTRRRLRLVGLLSGGLLLLIVSVWLLAGLYVDWRWFDDLGHADLYARRLLWQLLLFLGGSACFGLGCLLSLGLAGQPSAFADDQAVADEGLWSYLARVTASLDGDARRARRIQHVFLAIGLLLTPLFGLALAADWALWPAALNGQPFSLNEPLLGQEVGYYVFVLPLLEVLRRWLAVSWALIAVLSSGVYLERIRLELGVRTRGGLARLSRRARVHLALLGAAGLVLAAFWHQVDLSRTVLSTSGQAFRLAFPGYLAAQAEAPTRWVATLAALAAAAWLIWSARRPLGRVWLVGPALWGLAVVLSWLYPTLVQAVVLKPNEAVLERTYLAEVGDFARRAYGLDRLVKQEIAAEIPSGQRQLESSRRTLGNVRLWEPEPLRLGLNQLQAAKPYYGFFTYPDLDRYVIDGQARPVLVAARELDPGSLPARSWINTRLQFTHGYGLVAASASRVGADGRPLLVERDIPPVGPLGLERPEIYFGERTTEPALVRTAEPEIDYPRGDEHVRTRYEGRGGVSLRSPLSRLAHAIRLADLNLLLSPTVGPDSALLHGRQIAERVQRLAPFLLLDADPYPVVADGRLLWILDGLTVSEHFPLAPRVPSRLLAASPRPGETRQIEPNYLRASVKATVDAYDGAVRMYLMDPADPVAATYARVYPGLLQPAESIPASVRDHLRYPQQLFMAQADALARFHTVEPTQLYSGEDAWLVARGRFDSRPDARPVYGLQQLPSEDRLEFALTIPFRPYSLANDRHNLVALLAARSDGPHYGELVLYRYPRERAVEGPFQAELRIDQDPTVSAQFGLWQRSGAQVIRGDLQMLPLGNSVVYLESIFLQRADRAALPELQRVVVVAGSRVAMEPDLETALARLSGASGGPAAPGNGSRIGERQPSAAELARSAQEHLQRARAALLTGDRDLQARELQAADEALARLLELAR